MNFNVNQGHREISVIAVVAGRQLERPETIGGMNVSIAARESLFTSISFARVHASKAHSNELSGNPNQ